MSLEERAYADKLTWVLLAKLKKILDSKDSDTKTINSAAQDLKEYGVKVFSECQQRKEDTEKEDEDE